jgi:hypothetical protein
MRRHVIPLIAFAAGLAACNSDSPLPTSRMSHSGGLALSDVEQAANAHTLAALRQLTAKFHDLDAAKDAGYGLFIKTPLTAPDGCISDMSLGGMGYHYTRGNNLADDAIDLLDPEFLVYAPENGAGVNDVTKTRLAAFDYFLPYSPKWPAPGTPGFKKAPTFHDFPTTSDLPDVAFSPSRFDGWMIHIWLWEHNPDGMFANWNSSVRQCAGSSF